MYKGQTRTTTWPTTCSTKFLVQKGFRRTSLPIIVASSYKRSADLRPAGLQRHHEGRLSRILRTESAIKAIEQKANSKRHTNLWPKAVLEALDCAISENRWESALKIFELLRHQKWYQPRCRSYARLLMMLGKCKKHAEASVLFELLLSEGLQPTVDVYTALASAYGQSGLLEEAIGVVDDMKSISDCKPDVYTYSILIHSCVKYRRFDLIDRILAEMTYVGVKSNVVIYNTLIDGFGKAGMYQNMEMCIASMIESGNSIPDTVTLNSVVSSYGNGMHVEIMEKWYDEFQTMGVVPDVTTFNILIRSYMKAGMLDKMQSVLDFMGQRSYSPSIATYNTILGMYGKDGNIEGMEQGFNKMKHLGLKPNTITYITLVSAYSKAGFVGKVDPVLRQIENSDIVMDTALFNCIIHAFGQAGDIKSMAKLYLTMKEKNCEPDHITYSTMIRVYNAIGMPEIARDFQTKIMETSKINGSKLIGP